MLWCYWKLLNLNIIFFIDRLQKTEKMHLWRRNLLLENGLKKKYKQADTDSGTVTK